MLARIVNAFIAVVPDFANGPKDLGLPTVSAEKGLSSILNIVFTILGLLSVIFIIIGGVKYTLSGGDSAGIKSAKETITYAIVGLIVALLAFGIVNYVLHLK